MVVFGVLSRLTSGAQVPEPAQISNFCLKFMIKMADGMPDSVLATTEAGRDYADRLRAEQTMRRQREETQEPSPETIAALAPVMDNISTSMLKSSKGEIASARAAVADARRIFAALPEATTLSDQRERDEHLHLILGEELSLFHHAKDAEGILATQEERLALRYKISSNGREPHVVLNDILSYVADVAPLNPDRAMARLFPLFRSFPSTAPDWAHAVMLSAMGSLRHANRDNVGAMDAVAEMDSALGKAGLPSRHKRSLMPWPRSLRVAANQQSAPQSLHFLQKPAPSGCRSAQAHHQTPVASLRGAVRSIPCFWRSKNGPRCWNRRRITR